MTAITKRLRELAHAAANEQWREFSMRVSAEPERDADLVLLNAAKEIERPQTANAVYRTELAAISKALDDPRTDLTMTMVDVVEELVRHKKELRNALHWAQQELMKWDARQGKYEYRDSPAAQALEKTK